MKAKELIENTRYLVTFNNHINIECLYIGEVASNPKKFYFSGQEIGFNLYEKDLKGVKEMNYIEIERKNNLPQKDIDVIGMLSSKINSFSDTFHYNRLSLPDGYDMTFSDKSKKLSICRNDKPAFWTIKINLPEINIY